MDERTGCRTSQIQEDWTIHSAPWDDRHEIEVLLVVIAQRVAVAQ